MKKISILAYLVALLFFSCEQTSNKPNVIYILADDLGYGDLSCLGQQKLQTPNIDRLASEGMTFTNHYSGNTVCSPSRAVLMTGQDPGHVHCRGNSSKNHLDSTMITLPRLFKNAGYNTGIFGKWGLGTTNDPGSSNPLTHGFDEYFGPRTQMSAHTHFTDRLVHNGEIVSVSKNDHMNTLTMDKALNFIKENAAARKPFFCYIPTAIPHAAMHAPKALHGKWRKRFPEYDTIIGTYGAGKDEDCPDVINPIAGFAAMMEMLDNDVANILKTIEELGIDDNTLIIFTSDNGSHKEGGHDPKFWNSNGKFRGHKRDLYEGGIHTPALVRWPRVVKPTSMTDHISGFQDVLPTMAEITSQSVPSQVDGISFLPTLMGEDGKQQKHDYLFFEFWKGRDPQLVSQAVRMGDWKAIRRIQGVEKDKRKDATVADWPVELYNLKLDIGEQANVADDHPEVIEKAKRLFKTARTDVYGKTISD